MGCDWEARDRSGAGLQADDLNLEVVDLVREALDQASLDGVGEGIASERWRGGSALLGVLLGGHCDGDLE